MFRLRVCHSIGLLLISCIFLVYYGSIVDVISARTKVFQRSKRLKNVPEDCVCSEENFCFPGFAENNFIVYGKKFPCSLLDGLRSNHLLQEDIDTADDNADITNGFWEPVFVTSASSNHFEELRTFVERLRRVYTKNQLVIYNIGLEERQVLEVKTWCNIDLKSFNFSAYPEHVRNLRNYAFKLVILDALQHLTAFFYADTSVSYRSQAHEDILEAVKSGLLQGFATFPYTFHSIDAATHPQMYEYIPVAKTAVKMLERVSTSMIVVDSPYTRNLMKWWYLCAMTPSCIAPEGAVPECPIQKLRKHPSVYANCHRYDQSFWNLMYLTDLFGETQYSVTMGLTNPYTNLTKNIVKEVENKLGEHLRPLFKKTIRLHKGVRMKERYADKPGNCV